MYSSSNYQNCTMELQYHYPWLATVCKVHVHCWTKPSFPYAYVLFINNIFLPVLEKRLENSRHGFLGTRPTAIVFCNSISFSLLFSSIFSVSHQHAERRKSFTFQSRQGNPATFLKQADKGFLWKDLKNGRYFLEITFPCTYRFFRRCRI